MPRKKKARRPWKWIVPGASVRIVGAHRAVTIKKGPWLEGDRWFVSLRGPAGFWPVDTLECGICQGRGKAVSVTRYHDMAIEARVVRCVQCRGAGATKPEPDLQDELRAFMASLAGGSCP